VPLLVSCATWSVTKGLCGQRCHTRKHDRSQVNVATYLYYREGTSDLVVVFRGNLCGCVQSIKSDGDGKGADFFNRKENPVRPPVLWLLQHLSVPALIGYVWHHGPLFLPTLLKEHIMLQLGCISSSAPQTSLGFDRVKCPLCLEFSGAASKSTYQMFYTVTLFPGRMLDAKLEYPSMPQILCSGGGTVHAGNLY
jgi:hypothetical protein